MKKKDSRIKSPDKAHPFVLVPVFLLLKKWWNKNIWHKLLGVFIALVIIVIGGAYGISRWYALRHDGEPLQFGVTFVANYTRYLGIDPKETFHAILYDLGAKRVRLVSYWREGEPKPGQYDFKELDWQFRMAEQAGAKVSLAIGLRQPRWPECHMPKWAEDKPMSEWAPKLKDYMREVINRYKDSPALESWQLENEFFMKIFGDCPDHTRERLVDEYNFVKSLDSKHPVIITRSNNWGGVPIHEPTPDQFGIAVYKRVWDQNLTHRYFEYPYPPWFYGFLGGLGEIISGKSLIIHEMQAEPWIPDGMQLKTASLEEQDKSVNAKRLAKRFEYAKDTGIRTIDTWGVEWWYWRMVKHGDPSLWNVAKEAFANHE
ncbi:MAG TPA: hypothetical protein VK674_07275 [Candidatus Limnocylindria bacterium]|nr:hypothetical protein [Candidatus Limnocylindria bacterium]